MEKEDDDGMRFVDRTIDGARETMSIGVVAPWARVYSELVHCGNEWLAVVDVAGENGAPGNGNDVGRGVLVKGEECECE